VYDVSGAGDTVIATLTLALSAGADLLDATYLANYAAGIAVSKMGVSLVSADELMCYLTEWKSGSFHE
jgi:D-beta-D-heptose 7-phosphate kinase/D-beta-D-heptose 1-phosphate adenosyltransferase